MIAERPVALVTNACGYAGPAAVDALAAVGFDVYAHDRSSQDLVSAEMPPKVRKLSGESVSVFDTVWQETGRTDVIICNDHHPAILQVSHDVEIADLEETLDVLVIRPFAMLQRAIPRLKAQGGGNIIMITSCRTRLPMPGGAIPDMARAAANALVRSLAVELAPYEIAVNAIAPNFLYSETYYPKARFIDDQRGREFVKASVPVGRLGRPDEIGEIIAFLATSKARFLTGAIVDFSGGWPASPLGPAASDMIG
jgi:3-oxoacyl-[acyl-carrier protein] reductase